MAWDVAPLLLAFASTSETRRCAPPSLLAVLSRAASVPVVPVQVGIAAGHAAGLYSACDSACGLVSCGMAGGLDPSLPPGTLLLPEQVLLDDGTALDIDPQWHRRALVRLGDLSPLSTGQLASSRVVIARPTQKQALRAATGAVAVDMESAALACWAANRGLPFMVLRVLLDPAAVALPDWSHDALRSDGSLAVASLLGALLRRPGSLLEVPAMARNFSASAARCRSALAALGPALAPFAPAT